MGDLPSLRLDPPERRVILKAVRSPWVRLHRHSPCYFARTSVSLNGCLDDLIHIATLYGLAATGSPAVAMLAGRSCCCGVPPAMRMSSSV